MNKPIGSKNGKRKLDEAPFIANIGGVFPLHSLWSRLTGCLLVCAYPAFAAPPFDSAKVTKVENKVAVGDLRDKQASQRRAQISDVIEASNYLQTQLESRAELEFKDTSIVRVGQNTLFSFDAESRTLSLQRGAVLFYIPHGGGGGKIKTPSLTAAITGTIGEVGQTPDQGIIRVREGQVEAAGSDGQWSTVHAGQVGVVGKDGHLRVYRANKSEGALMAMGPLPGGPRETTAIAGTALIPDTRRLTDPFDRPDIANLSAEKLKDAIDPPKPPPEPRRRAPQAQQPATPPAIVEPQHKPKRPPLPPPVVTPPVTPPPVIPPKPPPVDPPVDPPPRGDPPPVG